jgi:hypothetical protein
MSVAFPNAGLHEGLPLGSTTMVDHSANRVAGGFDDFGVMGPEEAAFHRANFANVDVAASAPAEVSFLGRLGSALRGLFGLGTAMGVAATAMTSSSQRNMQSAALGTNNLLVTKTSTTVPVNKPVVGNTPLIPPKTPVILPVRSGGNYPFFVRRRRKIMY